MNRAFAGTLLVLSLGVGAFAADTTLLQPRKKFHLHKLGIAFKADLLNSNSESIAPKRIARPADQSIGDMTQQQANSAVLLVADFSPPLALANDRFTWSGGGTGTGSSIQLSYGSVGDRTVNLAVSDMNGSEKTTFAKIRTRFVSDTKEGDLCTIFSPDTLSLCPTVFSDGMAAAAWAGSPGANAQWGYSNPPAHLDNGKRNAAQHAYWNTLMFRDVGAPYAQTFADAHERETYPLWPFSDQPIGSGLNNGAAHNGCVMDLDNNLKGRQMGPNINFNSSLGQDDTNAQNRVVTAVLGGELTIMDDARQDSDGNVNKQGLLQRSDQ